MIHLVNFLPIIVMKALGLYNVERREEGVRYVEHRNACEDVLQL